MIKRLSGVFVFASVLGLSALIAEAEPAAPQPSEETQRLLDASKDADSPEEALAAAGTAAASAEASGDRAGFALAQEHRANALANDERLEEAIEALSRAREAWTQIGEGPGRIRVQCVMAAMVSANEPERADALRQEAIAWAREEEGRPLAAAQALHDAGVKQAAARRATSAEPLLRTGLEIREQRIPRSLEHADSLRRLATVAWLQRDLAQVEELGRRSLAILDEIDTDSLETADLLDFLAAAASRRGQLERGQEYVLRSLRIREAAGSPDAAKSLSNLGVFSAQRGDFDAAAGYLERALVKHEELDPGSRSVANTLDTLGSVARERGLYEEAVAYHRRSLVLRKERAPGTLDEARTLENLSVDLSELGELEEARALNLQALALKRQHAPQSITVAWALGNLGGLLMEQGDLETARTSLLEALAIFERLAPGSLDLAAIYDSMNVLALRLGDHEAAESYGKRALAIREEQAPDSLMVATSLLNMPFQDPEEAWAAGQRALAIRQRESPGSSIVAHSHLVLADLARDRGDVASTKTHALLARDIEERLAPASYTMAETLRELGWVAEQEGELRLARQHYERGLSIVETVAPESFRIAWLLRDLGRLSWAAGDLASAEAAFQRAWELRRAQAQAASSDDEAAQAYGEQNAFYAERLMRVQLGRGRTEEALETLEQARAQAMLQQLSERGRGISGVDPKLFQAEQRARFASDRAGEELASAGAHLARLKSGGAAETPEGRAQLSAAREAAESARSAFNLARTQRQEKLLALRQALPALDVNALTAQEARRFLPEGSLLVSFQVGTERTHAFLVHAELERPVLSYTLAMGREQLQERVADFREMLGRGGEVARGVTGSRRAFSRDGTGEERFLEQSRALRRDLFPPEARAAIAGVERLILSPDGPLWHLPFAALAEVERGETSWLGIDKALSYTPSLTALAVERRSPRPASIERLVLVVGDPAFAGAPPAMDEPSLDEPVHVMAGLLDTSLLRSEAGWIFEDGASPTRLPAAGREAAGVAELYGSEALLGAAATEAAVRERIGQAAVVHLATHGYLHPTRAMSSGLLLAASGEESALGESDDDGLLQAWEVASQLELSAELVVLSACETGRGEVVSGEGLVGLTRALQMAGARSVVSTQWQVADRASAALMLAFHQGLVRGLAKDRALREAMAEVQARAGTAHPFYWSGFLLAGDADLPASWANGRLWSMKGPPECQAGDRSRPGREQGWRPRASGRGAE